MKSAILLEGDIQNSHRVLKDISGILLDAAATLRAFGDSAAEVLRMSRGHRKMGRPKQPEVDFDNAIKRFLVRAGVVATRKRRAASLRFGLSEQITLAKS